MSKNFAAKSGTNVIKTTAHSFLYCYISTTRTPLKQRQHGPPPAEQEGKGTQTVHIRIDTSTHVPPFEQIRAQITLGVAAGRLRPGDRLPTIRTLAEATDVAPATVARSYRELINAGVAESRGRHGTFITVEPPVSHKVVQRHETLELAADSFVRAVENLDATSEDILESVILALRRSRGTIT